MTSCNYEIQDRAMVFKQRTILEDRLVSELYSANKSIKITNSNFRFKRLAKAIVEKTRNPNFEVFIYLDNQIFDPQNGLWSNLAEMEKCLNTDDCGEFTHEWSHYLASLKRKNLHIRLKAYSKVWQFSSSPLMHAKFIILDDLKVLTGSFNLFKASDSLFLENLIILDFKDKESQQPILNFTKHFNYLWNRNRDQEKSFSVLNPKSLSIEEFHK